MSAARYIALEGPEGCGKSSQAARLAADLGAVLTRETGGTHIGRRIREILHDVDHDHLTHRAEALLAAADRAQHLDEVVIPALGGGSHVVSDRSVHSTLAYQGYGRGLSLVTLRQINSWAVHDRWPDLVVLLDVHPATLAGRMAARELDRFERQDATFHERVTAGFHEMAAADPARWVVVDGNRGIDDVAATIRTAVRERLAI